MGKENIKPQWSVFVRFTKCMQDVMQFRNEEHNIRLLYTYNESVELRQHIYGWLEGLEENTVDKSNKLREKGNKVLKEEKNYWRALSYYTKAIYAAKNSTNACLAHGNRAYILMEKGFFQEAYEDCEYALNLKYPKEKEFKLVLRQAKCAIFLDDEEKLKQCKSKINKTIIPKKFSAEFSNTLIEIETKLENPKTRDIDTTVKPSKKEKAQILCSSSTKGTYVVAGEEILKDEEIMTEKAFAFIPLYDFKIPNYIALNCENCAESNIIPFPCNICRRVSYCSIKCRDQHEPLHKFECWGCKKELFRNISRSYLALRVLTVGLPDMLCLLNKNLKSCEYSSENLWKEILNLSKTNEIPYAHVIRLTTNLDRMEYKDLHHYILTALMLVSYLKNFSSFFDKIKELTKIRMSDIDWEIIVGALLLRHIAQMICNAYSITGIRRVDILSDFWKIKDLPNIGLLHQFQPSELFGAIYPRVSLYNHSCEPTFYNSFNKSNLTVKALKNLNVMEQIFYSYCDNIKFMDTAARKASIKSQFKFDCDCVHCESGDDREFKKYHTYVCKYCVKQFTLNAKNFYWWKKVNNTLMYYCPLCRGPICYFWYQYFDDIISRLSEPYEIKTHLFLEAFRYYKIARLHLTDCHKLKQEMALTMLRAFVDLPYDKSTNGIMINISKDLLNICEEKYGIYSLDFIYAATYYLDLTAIRISKLDEVILNDIEKILKSFQFLSDKGRKIYENYFNTYIENK